ATSEYAVNLALFLDKNAEPLVTADKSFLRKFTQSVANGDRADTKARAKFAHAGKLTAGRVDALLNAFAQFPRNVTVEIAPRNSPGPNHGFIALIEFARRPAAASEKERKR